MLESCYIMGQTGLIPKVKLFFYIINVHMYFILTALTRLVVINYL